MRLWIGAVLSLVSVAAYAGIAPPAELPEPGTLGLLAAAAVVVAIARRRRK